MPVNTVKKISTATKMKASATLEASPMPSQITNNGARITRGMALSSVITGSSSSAISGNMAAVHANTHRTARPPQRHRIMLCDARAWPLREQIDRIRQPDRLLEIMRDEQHADLLFLD